MRYAFTVILALCIMAGCGSKDDASVPGGASQSGPVETSSAERIIETGGFMPEPPGFFAHYANGGLAALGDIDGDGVTDLVAASGKHPGAIAAFSTRTGAEIWRVKGLTSSTAKEGEKPYTLGGLALVGDQNNDGIPDVFALNDWTKKDFLVLSGADGSILARADALQCIWPICVYDVTRDGVPDLLFHWPNNMAFRVRAGGTFEELHAVQDILGAPAGTRQVLIVLDYPDANGDGLDDMLAAVSSAGNYELAVISAADFSVIQRRPWPEEIALTQAVFDCPGDLNGDAVPDLIISAKLGAGETGDSSWLAALSGTDMSRLWQVNGDALPGGPRRFRINAKTKQRTDLPGDVGFGDKIVLLPDVDGDGIKDIAIATFVLQDDKSVQGVRLFSSATGSVIAEITLPFRKAHLVGRQIVYLNSIDKKGASGLALDVQLPAKKGAWGVAIVELPAP